MVRTAADINRVFPYNAQFAMVVRGEADRVELAGKLIHDLDKPKSEMLVDILVIESSSTFSRQITAAIASTGLNHAYHFRAAKLHSVNYRQQFHEQLPIDDRPDHRPASIQYGHHRQHRDLHSAIEPEAYLFFRFRNYAAQRPAAGGDERRPNEGIAGAAIAGGR